jgi:hypothetical protein
LSHSTSPIFVMGFFEIEFCELFAWGWLRTAIFLTSASWVARITGVRHWLPTPPTTLFLPWKGSTLISPSWNGHGSNFLILKLAL